MAISFCCLTLIRSNLECTVSSVLFIGTNNLPAAIAGWEYSVEPTLEVSYGPVEKTYHLCRRRRWVRSRKLVNEEEEEVSNVLHCFVVLCCSGLCFVLLCYVMLCYDMI